MNEGLLYFVVEGAIWAQYVREVPAGKYART